MDKIKTYKTLTILILKTISGSRRIRPCQIASANAFSRTSVHKVLKQLCSDGIIVKSGKMPKIYYHAVHKNEVASEIQSFVPPVKPYKDCPYADWVE